MVSLPPHRPDDAEEQDRWQRECRETVNQASNERSAFDPYPRIGSGVEEPLREILPHSVVLLVTYSNFRALIEDYSVTTQRIVQVVLPSSSPSGLAILCE